MKSPELALTIENLQQQLVELSPDEDSQKVLVACQKLASFAWLVDTIRFYRGFGFFGEFRDVQDGAIASRIINAHRKKHADEPVDDRVMWYRHFGLGADLELLRFTPSRVLFEDVDFEIIEDSFSYYHLFERINKIGGGLGLTQIREDWPYTNGVRTGPEVRFTYEGTQFHHKPSGSWSFLQAAPCVQTVNEVIAKTGYELVRLQSEFPTDCYVYLRTSDKKTFFSRDALKKLRPLETRRK